MTDEEKYHADVAAMMRQHGNVMTDVLNTKVAECLSGIVSSVPQQREQREEYYREIRVLENLKADLLNSVAYDDARRSNEQSKS